MRYKFFFFLLSRYLFSSWMTKSKLKQGSALATLIPLLGVTVGVFAFVVVLGVMSGFVENMKSELIKLTPHAQVISKKIGSEIPSNNELLDQIKRAAPNQVLSVTEFQSGDAILQVDNKATLISLEGVNPNRVTDVVDLDNYLVMGTGLTELSKQIEPNNDTDKDTGILFPSALIGRDLALQLNLSVGSVVTLVSILFDEGFAPLQMPVVISGIYDTGRMFLDNKMIYVSIETSNRFFSTPHAWTGVQLKLKNPFEPQEVVEKLNHIFNSEGLVVEDWTRKNSALLKALLLEHIGMIIVMSMIILVGCFSITISLLLSLHRKTRELAILRGLGLTQKDLSKLYLGQGFLIGTVGVVLGLLFGLLTLYLVHHFRVPIISDVYSGEPLPVRINFNDIIFVSIGSIVLATLAAFWPAYEVRRLNVIDVLAIRQ